MTLKIHWEFVLIVGVLGKQVITRGFVFKYSIPSHNSYHSWLNEYKKFPFKFTFIRKESFNKHYAYIDKNMYTLYNQIALIQEANEPCQLTLSTVI